MTFKNIVEGVHGFTLEKYSLCKGFGVGECFQGSNNFTVGGRTWAIYVFPEGTISDKTHGGDRYEQGHVYFGLHIRLVSTKSDKVLLRFKMTILDQSGNGDHWTQSSLHLSPVSIAPLQDSNFPCFIDREILESNNSSYLRDDCIKIECTIGVVGPPDMRLISIPKYCNDVGVDFLAMFKAGEGCDVVLNVRGHKFRAHRVILSARSSVFKSMFAPSKKEIIIGNVEPRVFKALLHFIYSDTFPEDEKCLVDGYAFGAASVSSTMAAKLFAAANQYDMKRLKSICESHLWRSISLKRFGEILSLAELCNAPDLKLLCFKYAAEYYDGTYSCFVYN
ncbi:PREDICTED: BTB/POZ and MATH domain-containing protein 4-like [Erythranthe guttata]|nr:PREDICTED: BTB/POZ and MATH domain-containing protein 4-like [Erythranthe guttata]|eukprot:XP_012829448.1 PREDICTED: BTB/POZ and MATH domain-containing protein 4-like [Erythranthe guttata]